MGDYDRGYRTGLRSYGSGDQKLEIVSGKVFSANQTYVNKYRSYSSYYNTYDPPRLPAPESPEPPLPYPPPPRRSGRSSGGGCGVSCFSDPEMKRRRRVARYKSYGAEGKIKASIRKGFRWIKEKCSKLVHGF